MDLRKTNVSATAGKSFDSIYKDCYHRCFLFAKSYLQDEALAKDVASEAMISLWNTLKTEEVKNVNAFLMTTVRNNSLNHLRHERIRIEACESIMDDELYELAFRISSLDACNPTTIFSDEIQRIVNQTLETLPSQTRNAFQMSRYENKSTKEIAEALGITVKGVDYHISKALKVLRTNLKDYLYSLLF